MKLPNKPKILAATRNPVSNTKMISFLVDFPTALLPELRTHRVLTQGACYEHSELVDFNLSANSMRAVPINTLLKRVEENPFIPIWTKKQKGMSGELLEDTHLQSLLWNKTSLGIIDVVKELERLEVHKQNANRLLSPFTYTTCIITGTEWDNFWSLRNPKYEFARYNEQGNKITHYEYAKSKKEHIKQIGVTKPEITPDTYSDNYWQSINISSAQPEFQIIAEMLYDLYQEADWKESKYHIPFEEEIDAIIQKYQDDGGDMSSVYDRDSEDLDFEWAKLSMKISASLCAKLSYDTQNNEDTLEKHLERADMLIENKHWEPFSHQAISMTAEQYGSMFIQKLEKHNGQIIPVRILGVAYNLRGFISQRYILENF